MQVSSFLLLLLCASTMTVRHSRADKYEIEPCPSSDPVVRGTPISIPEKFRNNYVGTYPVVPGLWEIGGFRFVDADNGLLDVEWNYLKANATRDLGYSNSKEWCNTIGLQSFRVTFYGMCLAYSDDDYDYFKSVATMQIMNDCFEQPNPGTCRMVKMSKKAPGEWVEYESGTLAAGGGIEWVHGGNEVGMRLKYSLCPSTIDEEGSRDMIYATFNVSSVDASDEPVSSSHPKSVKTPKGVKGVKVTKASKGARGENDQSTKGGKELKSGKA